MNNVKRKNNFKTHPVASNKQNAAFKENDEINNILSKNPTAKELRQILRLYGFKKLYQKKEFLVEKFEKLIFYFQHLNEIHCIQRLIRKFVFSIKIFLHGDVFRKETSTNIEDFCTLGKISDNPLRQLISFRNSSGCLYSFELDSLQKLQSFGSFRNPYTRERINVSVFDRLGEILYRKKHKPKKNSVYDHSLFWTNRKNMIMIEQECRKNKYELRYDWVMETPIDKLHKLYGILYDIWNMQNNLTTKLKMELVPDTNDSLSLFPVSKHSIWYNRKIDKVRKIIINIILKLSFSSQNKIQILGVILILCSTIRINSECHTLYSWLDV